MILQEPAKETSYFVAGWNDVEHSQKIKWCKTIQIE